MVITSGVIYTSFTQTPAAYTNFQHLPSAPEVGENDHDFSTAQQKLPTVHLLCIVHKRFTLNFLYKLHPRPVSRPGLLFAGLQFPAVQRRLVPEHGHPLVVQLVQVPAAEETGQRHYRDQLVLDDRDRHPEVRPTGCEEKGATFQIRWISEVVGHIAGTTDALTALELWGEHS